MEVRLLGPVEVHADTGQLPVRGPIQRALVAMLALHANRVVISQELLRSVWGPEASSAELPGCPSRGAPPGRRRPRNRRRGWARSVTAGQRPGREGLGDVVLGRQGLLNNRAGGGVGVDRRLVLVEGGAGTNRAQLPAHSRTWPGVVGHTPRPLTFIRPGQ
jgi:hypothetical protein